MIVIKKASGKPLKQLSYKEMYNANQAHRDGVRRCMEHFRTMLKASANTHDIDKFHEFDKMYKAVQEGKAPEWFNEHCVKTRHHIVDMPGDVNLIDLLEMISDTVTARMSKLDNQIHIFIDPVVLNKAVANTVKLLMNEIVIKG